MPRHPYRVEAEKQFNGLMVDDDARGFFCSRVFLPVWDTALAAFALAEMENPPVAVLRRTADWLLSKEVRRKGDWSVKRPECRAFGLGLSNSPTSSIRISTTRRWCCWRCCTRVAQTMRGAAGVREARALNWLLAMQSQGRRLGGLRRRQQLGISEPRAVRRSQRDARSDLSRHHRPRAGSAGAAPVFGADHAAVRRGVDYLLRTQEQDGSWYGRWGVELHLRDVPGDARTARRRRVRTSEALLRAGEWLRSYQNRRWWLGRKLREL